MTRQRPHHLRPRLDTARVALVYRDFAGTGVSHIGLGISAAYTAKTLRQHGVWAEVWPTQSPQKLAERLHRVHAHADAHCDVRPTHVVLSAPWVPTNDEPEDLTTTADQSETETSPLAVEAALGNTAFATNLDEVTKALRKMKEELDAKPGKKAPAKKAADPASDGWPLDLNSESFRKGVEKADDAPAWGFDPEGVRAPKAE